MFQSKGGNNLRKPNNDEIAHVLAKIAMGVCSYTLTDFERFAVQLFTEDLVLPKDMEEYSEKELYEHVVDFLSNKR